MELIKVNGRVVTEEERDTMLNAFLEGYLTHYSEEVVIEDNLSDVERWEAEALALFPYEPGDCRTKKAKKRFMRKAYVEERIEKASKKENSM